MTMAESSDEGYMVRQAFSPAGDPLPTYHVFRGETRMLAFADHRRVTQFFSMRRDRPDVDESRWPLCPVCNIARPEDAPRHAQTTDGRVTRGHRFVSYR